jgi:hypothetical protein
VLLAVPVALLTLRLVWGAYADYQVTAARREMAALGMRTDLKSFHKHLPAARNAAAVLARAFDEMKLTKPQHDEILGWDRNEPNAEHAFSAAEIQVVREALAANAAVLKIIDDGTALPEGEWPPLFSDQGDFDHRLTNSRTLVELLGVAAIVAHEDGDDGAAIRHLQRMRTVARVIGQDPTLLAHLLSLLEHRIAAGMAIRMAFSFSNDSLRHHRDELRQLAADLAATEPLHIQARNALEYEALSDLDDWERYTKKLFHPGWLVRPVVVLDAVRGSRGNIEMWRQSRGQALPKEPRSRAKPAEGIGVYVFPLTSLSSGIGFSEWRALLLTAQGRTDCQGAATLLALQLCQAEHGGRLPDRLEALVPAYLPQVPQDLFAPDAGPLHYRAVPLTVWSVGENGADDGGTHAPGARGSRRRWREPDALYDAPVLIPTPLAPPPGGGPPP